MADATTAAAFVAAMNNLEVIHGESFTDEAAASFDAVPEEVVIDYHGEVTGIAGAETLRLRAEKTQAALVANEPAAADVLTRAADSTNWRIVGVETDETNYFIRLVRVDNAPPSPPIGVFISAGDGQLTVSVE